jgi:NitT/TauT family transport system ATP-binding protein
VTQPALRTEGLTLRHRNAAQPVLADFDLTVPAGDIVAILGPSGVGKSSLLRALAGLEPPAAGRIQVEGAEVTEAHPRVAMAFQDPSLLPWLTLEKNVAFGLDFRRQPRLDRRQRQDRIDAAIRQVGLSHARHRYPAHLSGGMAQRTALARCLARDPKVLLLDEPFGALDEVTRADMQSLLLDVVAGSATAAVLITHDIEEALLLADRILLLGGAPARVVGDWTLDLPKPRQDVGGSALDAVRVEILRTLRAALPRH